MANSALETLKSCDLSSIEFGDLTQLISKAFHQVQITVAIRHPPSVFCRARVGDHLFTRVADISYNPKCGPGRCNIEGRPMFYAANSMLALPFEVPGKAGQVFTIGYWRSKRPLLISTFGFSQSAKRRLGTTIFPPPHADVNLPVQENSLATDCYEFFNHAFTERIGENNLGQYKLTAAFADLLLREIDLKGHKIIPSASEQPTRVDGIMYPSVATKGNAHNYAFLPSTVDTALELFRAESFRIDEFDGNKISVARLLTGFPFPDGSIRWTGKFEQEYEVLLGKGFVRVLHTDEGYEVHASDGTVAIGF